MADQILEIAGQLLGIVSTVLAAAWYLSSRLERLTTSLDTHTQVVNQRIDILDKQLGALQTIAESNRQEASQLRERTVRLEAKVET
jgi:hypothetical protein